MGMSTCHLELNSQAAAASKNHSGWRPFPPALFGLLGKLNGVPEVGFRAALHLIADRPMVLPKGVFGVVPSRIHEGQSPLKIVDQRLAGQFRKLAQEGLVEPVGIIGIAARMERSEERRVGKECRSRWS